MLDWLEGRITPQEWRAVTGHGFALLAVPLAADAAIPLLRERLAEAEAALPAGAEARGCN
jgi:hypothetical protein